MTTLFVPGTPAPQGSTKAFLVAGKARITHANTKTMPWRDTITAFIINTIGDGGIKYPAGPVNVELTFIMPRRAAEPKRITPAHTRKPDTDKLIRAVLDSMTGLIFTDDSQVVDIHARKITAAAGQQPGVTITWEGSA